jgi:hypothetical protein
MKKIYFLSFCFLILMRVGNAQQTAVKTISVDLQQATIGQFVADIEAKAGYHFYYEPTLFDSLKITVKVDNKPVEDVLDAAFKKIESKATQDSKLLSDMNNALNWILSLTTVMFVLYIRLSTSNTTGLNDSILHFGRILFALLIIILIFHKIILLRYEKAKGQFIESLRTHYIDLKFDFSVIKNKYNFNDMPGIEDFTNNLENGTFLSSSHPSPAFLNLPKPIKKYAFTLRATFWAGVSIFCLYFFEVIILLRT